MKKGIFKRILPFLVMGVVLALSPLFFKAYARGDYYSLDSGSQQRVFTYVAFNTSRLNSVIINYNGNLIYTNLGNITISTDGDNYYINNNTQYPILTDYVYLFVYEKGISHTLVYLIDIDYNVNNFSYTDITPTYLFTISQSTGTLTYYDIFNEVLQYSISTNSPLTDSNIQSFLYGRINGTFVTNLLYENYNLGYSRGYNTGYDDGQAGETAITPFFNFMTNLWTGVDSVLSIEIVPHITLWYFIAVPLFFLVVWAVLRIWKHG